MAICEICNKDRANSGPFRDDKTGQKWALVCGGCKVRWTLADPERRARLESSIRAALAAPILPRGAA